MNDEIIKYRLSFSKTDKMRYIGHLDLLTYFQRAIKRAEIPISYSKGFNPHQQMSFAMPLPLGMSGTAEYVDIQLDVPMECEEIKNRLNAQMSLGMEITSVRRMEQGEDTGAALLRAADYTAVLDRKITDIETRITELEKDEEWLIEKVGKKKKVREIDIKPLIYSLDCNNDSENTVIRTRIASGSNENLKVDLLLKYLYEKMGYDLDFVKIKVTRTALLKQDENGGFSNL